MSYVGCEFMHIPKKFKSNNFVVDLRSDSVTKPTLTMRRAMAEAEVGDDVYSEDPTVNELEERVAELFDKEVALFVPSGSMGNLIALMNHCDVRGSEAYCGEESHIVQEEQGSAASIAGVTICSLPNEKNGTFNLKRLEEKIRGNTLMNPVSKLVVVENTITGRIVPESWLTELTAIARKHKLKMHLDGARVWNASMGSGMSLREIAKPFDSVCCSLSRGLGAPVGSVLCGTRSFINKARRTRKALGGAMRQAGVLAAAGLTALDEMLPKLQDDHRRAKAIAWAIQSLESRIFQVDPAMVQTNVVTVRVNSVSVTAEDFVDRLETIRDEDDEVDVVVRGSVVNRTAQFVTHHQVTDKMVQAAVRKIEYVIRTFEIEN